MIQFPSIPQYILESSFSLLVFYSVYHLLLKDETFFRFNKFYLLSTVVFSLLIPLIDIDIYEPIQALNEYQDSHLHLNANVHGSEIEYIDNYYFSFTVGDIIKAIFYIGIFLFTLKFLHSLFQLMDQIKRKQLSQSGDSDSRSVMTNTPSNAIFGFLHWNDEVATKDDVTKQNIVSTSLKNIKPWNSIEVVLMEISLILNWFNPLLYLYRKSLRSTHEFISDDYYAIKSDGRYQYAEQMTEMYKSQSKYHVQSIQTPIMQRVLMLSKKRTGAIAKLKLLAIVPIAISLFALFSFDYSSRLPLEIRRGIAVMEMGIDNACHHTVVNLSHSKHNYDWEFRWGESIYGLNSRGEDGSVKYDISKEVSLYDLYSSIAAQPSFKTKGVFESMGFDIKITSNSDTVSNISVPIGDYDGLENRMKSEISKHKIPFSIYFSNIRTANNTSNRGFMIKVYQYLNNLNDIDEAQLNKKVVGTWGDLDIDAFRIIQNVNGKWMGYDRFNFPNLLENPTTINRKDLLDKVNSNFIVKENDVEVPSSDNIAISLNIARKEMMRSNTAWNPLPQKEKTSDGIVTVRKVSTAYHGRMVSTVIDEYDFKSLLEAGDSYLKGILETLADGDKLTINFRDTLALESKYVFFLQIEDEDSAYRSPYKLELPPTSETYSNFQIYYNSEDDKTYVKVDTTIANNENVVKAYRHSESYNLSHVPDFKTKNRVNDDRVLPAGELSVDVDMDLNVSVLRIENLNEYYTLNDRMIRMDWGNMVSVPGIGNFSFKEFKRSSRSNILLSAGDEFLNVVRFDIVIVKKDQEPIRIRTNNPKSDICRQYFKEVQGEASIYFDNIIINDNDEFKYYPYQFVFNVE